MLMRTLKYTFYILMLLFGLLALTSQFYLDSWFGDLISNFRNQYIAIFVILTLLALVMRDFLVSALFVAFSLFFILSYNQNIHAASLTKMSLNHGEYSITTFNVHVYNGRFNAVTQFIKKENSDIVVLQEVSKKLYKKIQSEKWDYIYSVATPSYLNDYLVILSRYPLVALKPDVPLNSGKKGTMLNVVCDLPHGTIRIIGVHLTNPLIISNFGYRTEEYEHLIQYIGKESKNLIVAGDFNTTPWSSYMNQLAKESGMRLHKKDYVYQATWMRRIPFIAIPIDHVLLGERFTFLDRTVHHDRLGSEHHPVTVKFGVVDMQN